MAAIDTAETCAGKIAYVFGGSRYDFWDGTDCSGVVCAALWQVHGIDPNDFGTWTGAQWADTAYTREIWWGQTAELPWDDMQRGDLIFTSNCSADFSTGNGSHVGFYTGDPSNPFYSHFATYGPRWTAVNGVYGNECYFGVKRILKEEASPEPEYKSADVQLYTGNATDAQRWAVSRDKHGWVTLTSVSCGLVLDAEWAGTCNGTKVRVFTPNGSDAQKWKTKQYEGTYVPKSAAPRYIYPKHAPDMRLDAQGNGTADGTAIQLYEANGTDAQKWQIIDHGDGTWSLLDINASKFLDVAGGGV